MRQTYTKRGMTRPARFGQRMLQLVESRNGLMLLLLDLESVVQAGDQTLFVNNTVR